MKIYVLRLGHRVSRDQRISTHCGLVARAFGANGIFYSGEKDDGLIQSLEKTVKNWGGKFEVSYVDNWRKLIKSWKGVVIHLTMYGLPVQKEIKKIRKTRKNFLVIVGGEKVPAEVYHLADWNLSVTNQPHSEISSLAVFLHEYFKGKDLGKKFKKAKLKIIPQKIGKKVVGK